MTARELIRAEPHILVTDMWYSGIPGAAQAAYKACIATGMIKLLHVLADTRKQQIVVQYMSAIPEKWIHETLRDMQVGNFQKYEEVCKQLEIQEVSR